MGARSLPRPFFNAAPSALQCASLANCVVMNKHSTILLKFAAILFAVLFYPHAAAASAIPPAPASIAPDMTVTLQNWERYRQFMSEGLIALFEGQQFWRLPKDLRIEVGPSVPIPLPKRYLADTAEYSNRVKLVRTSSGGYAPMERRTHHKGGRVQLMVVKQNDGATMKRTCCSVPARVGGGAQ
jgi:hypothetical protein